MSKSWPRRHTSSWIGLMGTRRRSRRGQRLRIESLERRELLAAELGVDLSWSPTADGDDRYEPLLASEFDLSLAAGSIGTWPNSASALADSIDQFESESNDSFATANSLTVPTQDILTATNDDWLTIGGSIGTGGDVDYFTFTLAAASGVFIDVDARDLGISGLDSRLTLFNASQQAVSGGSNNNGFSFRGFDAPLNSTSSVSSLFLDPAVYVDLPAGTYYVQVDNQSNTTNAVGDYQLWLLADTTYSTTPPVLNSLSGATDTLYLDFDGHAATDAWGTYDAEPFDFNNVPNQFSPAERLAIQNTWRVTSEDYRPFRLNVTTVNPGSFANGQAYRMVMTESDSTVLGRSGGTLGFAFRPSYASGGLNVKAGFVFATNFSSFGAGTSGRIMAAALEMGNTAAHEFGHALGLRHYATASGDPDAGSVLPNGIMSTPDRGLNREVWQTGTAEGGTSQDDVAVIGNTNNTIGYRADDHGGTLATATDLTSELGTTTTASGILERLTDRDVFQFFAEGDVILRVDVDGYVSNVDVELRLLDSLGNVVGLPSSPTDSFGAAMTTNVPAGVYYADVRSNGDDGEQGSYKLSVTTVDSTPPLVPVLLNNPAPIGPPGAMMFVSAVSSTIEAEMPVRVYEIPRDELTSLSLELRPDSAMQASISVRRDDGALLANVNATQPGEPLLIQNLVDPLPGSLFVEVSGISGAIGSYLFEAIYNAAPSFERTFGQPNDSPQTAEEIGSTLGLAFGDTPMTRASVLGTNTPESPAGGEDWYRFAIPEATPTTIVYDNLEDSFVNSATIELYDSSLNRLSVGLGADNFDLAIRQFVAPPDDGLADVYFVRVINPAARNSVTVLQGGDFDRELNSGFLAAQDLSGQSYALGHLDAGSPPSANIDTDFYSVAVNVGDDIVVRLGAVGDGSDTALNALAPAVELIGPDGTVLVSDMNVTTLPSGRVEVQHSAIQAGIYRVRASAANQSRGSYELTIAGATGLNRAPLVVGIDPPAGSLVASLPESVAVEFSEALLLTSLDAADVRINGVAAAAVTILDGARFRFGVPTTVNVEGGIVVVELSPDSVVDLQGRPLAGGARLEFELEEPPPAPPTVVKVQINDGSLSRSQVTSLTVTFDSLVDHVELASAFVLTNIDSVATVTSLVVAPPIDQEGQTSVTLRLGSGPSVVNRQGAGSLGNSLADGNYQLDVLATHVRTATGNVTMASNFRFGGQTRTEPSNDNFFRLLGEFSGDGIRNNADLAVVVSAFTGVEGYRTDADVNGDGLINNADLAGLVPTVLGPGRR